MNIRARIGLILIACLFCIIAISKDCESSVFTIGGMYALDTVKTQSYGGLYARLLVGHRIFPSMMIRDLGYARLVLGAEVDWLWPFRYSPNPFRQFFIFFLVGLRHKSLDVYSGVSPVIVVQRGTRLYYPGVYYLKLGAQLNYKILGGFLQLSHLYVFGQAPETIQNRLGIEVGLGLSF